jgi:CHAT domain-containing protein
MLGKIRARARRRSRDLHRRRDIDAELGWSPVRAVPEIFEELLLAAQHALERNVDGRNRESADALVNAWKNMIDHPEFGSAPSSFRADVLNRSAIALQWSAEWGPTMERLTAAVAQWQDAVRLLSTQDSKLPGFLSNQASAQLVLYQLGGDPSDLDAAIIASERARDLAATGSGRFAGLAAGAAASALDTRFRKHGDPADIARAVELAEEAVRIGESLDHEGLDGYRGVLSDMLARRFDAYGSIDDLRRAIAQRELVDPASTTISPGIRDGGLGRLLRLRWTVQHDPADIDRAVELLRRALEDRGTDGVDNPVRATNLGNALLDRYAFRGELSDLLDAVKVHEHAVDVTQPTDWQLASRHNNAGNSRLTLFEHNSAVDERRRSIEHYRRAIELTAAGEPERASRLYNLGRALSAPGPGFAEAEGVDAFRQACAAGLSAGLEWALASSRTWGQAAAERERWDEAAEALQPGLEAVDRLFRRQLSRDEKETWLSRARGVAADAALALAMIGKPADAAVALERGRAYLLSEVLERDHADLRELEIAGRQDLAVKYRDASSRLRRASGADDTRAARDELDSAITAIRDVPNLSEFLRTPIYRDIESVATDTTPLVYLVGASRGGLALIVSPHGETPSVVHLPELTDESIALRARALWQAHANRHARPSAWPGTLDAVTAWLWRAVAAPLLATLEPTQQAAVVPVGVLGVLPLHAAWTPDRSSASGRRYLLDRLTLSYVPNARSLAAARENAEGAAASRLLAVRDPAPSRRGKVPAADAEVATITGRFAHALVQSGADANRENILSLLDQFDVVHFACHGIAFTEEPLDSALSLAADELLTLRDLLDLGRAGAAGAGSRLAVLSACEASRPGDSLPDEVVSLPSGMLQAGFAGVVAPQWAVDGPASAMLMAHFYEAFPHKGQTPATSLRNAQCWLRDTTNAEKATWFADQAAAASNPEDAAAFTAMWRATVRKPPDSRAHTNPQYWAAFAHYGV